MNIQFFYADDVKKLNNQDAVISFEQRVQDRKKENEKLDAIFQDPKLRDNIKRRLASNLSKKEITIHNNPSNYYYAGKIAAAGIAAIGTCAGFYSDQGLQIIAGLVGGLVVDKVTEVCLSPREKSVDNVVDEIVDEMIDEERDAELEVIVEDVKKELEEFYNSDPIFKYFLRSKKDISLSFKSKN